MKLSHLLASLKMDKCIYHKVNGSKIIFFILYVDDILLATNDLVLLYKVKKILFKSFDMKDMGDAYYVIGIKIHREMTQHLVGLS